MNFSAHVHLHEKSKTVQYIIKKSYVSGYGLGMFLGFVFGSRLGIFAAGWDWLTVWLGNAWLPVWLGWASLASWITKWLDGGWLAGWLVELAG